eukprot:527176_1
MDPCLEIHQSSCDQATISSNCNCNNSITSICITGQTTYNDWFYTQYEYSGCYGSNPYYYNSNNGYYIYWSTSYNRWQSNDILGSTSAQASDSIKSNSLFASNGKWYVISPIISTNMDPCLEIHQSSCAGIYESECNVCNNTVSMICIAGSTSYNDWFYTQYEYSGCYGSNPYYYSALNGYYIYWELAYNRWQSNDILGSTSAQASDSIKSNSLFASNG